MSARPVTLPLTCLLVAALLVGCGGAESSSPPSAPGASGPDASPATSSGGARTPGPASAPSDAPTAGPSNAPAPGTDGPTSGPPALALETVAGGLDSPLDVAIRPGDPSSLLVAEQDGRLRVVRDGSALPEPFLDIVDRVTAGGEQGLLGVAVHPDPADGRVFVYYTDRDERQVVSSFATSPDDPDRADPASERRILVMEDRFGNHNGGGLAFGPDGFLYISTGDGGGAGDPLGSGRSLDTLLAKILRVDIDVPADAESPYGIPEDNPWLAREGARPELWHTGLRNPWRIRFDAPTGDLWIGDVGQGEREEIDRAPAGVGGLDFGWNTMEGSDCYREDDCARDGLALPIAEYGHDQGCSVTGGAVYRGTRQPGLQGWYVLSDYCSGRFWLIDAAGGEGQEPVLVLESGRSISAIAPDADGELLATDLGAGELLRVVVAP